MGIGQSGFHSSVIARRRAQKKRPGVAMNLVSLMDIFTILVFFLLVNSSNVEVLPGKASVTLPKSVADDLPEQTVVVTVSPELILLQGEVVDQTTGVDEQEYLPGLLKALQQYRDRHGEHIDKVTILGDRQIPYALLKRVMSSCARAQFAEISLAVEQAPRKGGA